MIIGAFEPAKAPKRRPPRVAACRALKLTVPSCATGSSPSRNQRARRNHESENRSRVGAQTLACSRGDRCRAVHGHCRCRGRERGAAGDQGRPSLLPGQPAVGDHRLLDPVRRNAAAGRPTCRPARTQAAVHGRGGCVHARLVALRARLVGRRADRHPGAAGPWRRSARAGCAFDRRHHLPRGA